MQFHNINSEIEKFNNEVELRIRKIMREKERLEQELSEAKTETERIRKEMFTGYQEIIGNLKTEIIELKEKNVDLSDRSEYKVEILKLERDNKMLRNKLDDLTHKNK